MTDLSLEGWVQRTYHRLPASLRAQHGLHRRRLDVYATLTLVMAVLGILGVAFLQSFGWEYAAWVVGLSVVGLALSYGAALEAAGGYVTALESISAWKLESSEGVSGRG